ncbi:MULTISPECIES: chaplin [Streptomyces]|uniref:Chaplin n=1 Tax=Streptomyces siderophoricus TaxID=2802281 RepID=A0ABS1MTM0_9ACTN|nr:chaplin [Streptomyces sp. 9-7]MBL1091126.1 chaplin [Streptomyces sp. 9-7]
MRIRTAVAATALTAAAVLGGAGVAAADSGAGAAALNSPGVISGNTIQIPIHLPIHLCGNSIDIIGLVNPAFGNTCLSD